MCYNKKKTTVKGNINIQGVPYSDIGLFCWQTASEARDAFRGPKSPYFRNKGKIILLS